MSKLKTIWQKFKKLIIGFLIGSTALAAGLGAIDTEPVRIETINIDDKSVSVNYTDENSNEDLIIHSDQKDYSGLGTVGIIVSVYNTGQSQNVKFAVSTPNKQGWEIIKVQEYGGEIDVNVSGTPDIITATGTIKGILSSTIKRTTWNDIGQKQYQNAGILRKDVKEKKTEKESNSFYLAKGETKFFKIQLKYSSNDEFFIEAFGDNGGYGHLDPWTYEQNFNGLTTADLTGQDSWSGSTSFDVQTSVMYEGAKAVSVASGADVLISRSVTAISAGSVYFAMRITAATQATVNLMEGANTRINIIFQAPAGNIGIYDNDFGDYRAIGTYSINQWYVVNVEWDNVAQPGKARARRHDGTSWGAWTSWYTVIGGSYTNIDTIRLRQNNNAANTFYFDTITGTDPTIVAAVTGEEYLIIFE